MAKKRTSQSAVSDLPEDRAGERPEFPFLQRPLPLIDLGKWASGAYVISAPINDPEDIELIQSEDHGKKPN